MKSAPECAYSVVVKCRKQRHPVAGKSVAELMNLVPELRLPEILNSVLLMIMTKFDFSATEIELARDYSSPKNFSKVTILENSIEGNIETY
ncbi:hypothetical protein MTR_7g013370 [Medicago truncatula]|uniref:Uncharacterized protein n=1 Tax=Medicago truncatula TaxID=3880 RepID=G7L5A8_MEDTR|nr:hypothetical protein MTR_7g013370 [Medicago truncatula]